MFKKTLLTAVFVFSLLSVSVAHADTAADLQDQINAILAQIKQLQVKLSSAQTSTGTSVAVSAPVPTTTSTMSSAPVCLVFTFTRNLSVATTLSRDEANALRSILVREGVWQSGADLTVFNDDVASAVVDFQSKYGIQKTGTIGPITRAKLNSLPCTDKKDTPVSCPVFYTNLSRGSRGTDVIALQTVLIKRGFDIPNISSGQMEKGLFDAQTFDAVVRFQGSIGVEASGFVGPLTRAALNALCASSGTAPKITGTSVYPSNIQAGQTVSFSWTANDPQNDDLAWSVDFGDSNGVVMTALPSVCNQTGKGTSYSTAHAWANAGTYQMKVAVSSCNGESDSVVIPVTVVGQTGRLPVITGLASPTTLTVGQSGTWTISAYDPDGTSLSYSVSWGDEPTTYNTSSGTKVAVTSTFTQNSTFSHAYSNSGTYTPTFTVSDANGLSAKTSTTVHVTGQTNQSSITLLSPNGGETWNRGTQKTINWTSNSGMSYNGAVISVGRANTTNEFYHIASLTYDTDNVSWIVGQTSAGNPIPDGKYFIKICVSGVCDDSDNFFTIVSVNGAPTISTVSPQSAVAGTPVTITGENFGSGTHVFFSQVSGGSYFATIALNLVPDRDVTVSGDGRTVTFKVPAEFSATSNNGSTYRSFAPGSYNIFINRYVGGRDLFSNSMRFEIVPPVVSTVPPTINDFKISQPVTTDVRSTNLVWSTSAVATCVVSGPNFPANNSYGANESISTGVLLSDATYTLTCKGLNGTSVSKSLSITVPPVVADASVTASLLASNEDRAGQWGVFAPGTSGGANRNPEDWNFKATLTVPTAKSIKYISIYHTSRNEGWSTSKTDFSVGGALYPIVVFRDGTQVNSAYDQELGSYKGTQELRLFGQKESTTFNGATLVVVFTDGTKATTQISSTPVDTNPLKGTNHSFGAKKDTVVKILIEKFTINASEASGNIPITISSIGPATEKGGKVELQSGFIVYTPPSGYIGPDSFTFVITDGKGRFATSKATTNILDNAKQPSPNVSSKVALPNGQTRVTFVSMGSSVFTVEVSTDKTNWTMVGKFTSNSAGVFTYDDPAPATPERFYHIENVGAAPSFSVVSPNGGESFKVGDTITVKWQASNLSSPAKIYLGKADTAGARTPMSYEVLVIAPVGQGSQTVTIGKNNLGNPLFAGNLPSDNRYVIRIEVGSSITPGSEYAQDESDGTFTIAANPSDTEIITNLESAVRQHQASVVVPKTSQNWDFDVDADGYVNARDVLLVRSISVQPEPLLTQIRTTLVAAVTKRLGLTASDAIFIPEFDVDKNGTIDTGDLARIRTALGLAAN